MRTYARLNDAGNIVELRDFHPQEVTPVDIPHKGVRWREVIEDPIPDHDTRFHAVSTNVVFEGDEVRRIRQRVDLPVKTLIEAEVEAIRKSYRNQIVDALPDLERVAELVQLKDDAIANMRAIGSVDELRGLHDANG